MKLFKTVFVFCCIGLIILFSACSSQEENAEVLISLESSNLGQEEILVSTSKNAKMISFDENLPEIYNIFGNTPYKTYSATIYGIARKESIKNKLVPVKADGTHWQATENKNLIENYVDYFTLKIKLLSNETSIRFSPNAESEPLNKLRIINGNYYLNFVWLNLDKTKTNFSLKEYEPENYIYIETLSPTQKTIQKFILKLTYDITFV